MESWKNTDKTAVRSGLIAPTSRVAMGEVCPEQARDRVSGLVARHDFIPTGAFGTVPGPRPCSPPV